MTIGILGAGRMGTVLATQFTRAGRSVAICNSRGADTLAWLIAELGPNVAATTPAQAVELGDVLVLALPWCRLRDLPSPELFVGKIVIDATNPYGEDGQLADLEGRTSSVIVAGLLPGARIVKAFNTIHWETLAKGSRPASDERLVIFVASDDVRAKSIVSRLIEDIGFAPVDTGSLKDGGRRQQPGTELYNRPITIREARQMLAGTC